MPVTSGVYSSPVGQHVVQHSPARRGQLCRYLLRPPLADARLRLLGDGRVRVRLKRAWSDGTTHLLFELVEFLEKLAALTPRPAINLIKTSCASALWRPDGADRYHRRPPRSFTGFSRIPGCREHATARSPRSLCFDRETTTS